MAKRKFGGQEMRGGFSPASSAVLSGVTRPYGIMRPLFPAEKWEAITAHGLRLRRPKVGLWYMDRVPKEWVVDEKALAAGPIEVGDWWDALKMSDAFAQQRLASSVAASEIPVELGVWGPTHEGFGLKIDDSASTRIAYNEASMLGAKGDPTRLTLGDVRVADRPEVIRQLAAANRQSQNYLGPLCVVSSVLPPAA